AVPSRSTAYGRWATSTVEPVGSEVTTVEPGRFVVGSFVTSDGTCELCRAGYPSACVNRVFMDSRGTQAQLARIPLADGALVAASEHSPAGLIPSLLLASDVLGPGDMPRAAREASVPCA